MIEIADSLPNILVLTISGKVTAEDLDKAMDRLEIAMDEHAKVHAFIETIGLTGFEISGLADYASRAAPLWGKLGRFGRVAIVADQLWVRLASKLESLLLPHISYRVFEPGDRTTALDWVEDNHPARASIS